MEKKVLAGASREKQKYFFEPAFNEIPQAVKDEIRNICILMAERLGCTFLMSFEETGDLVFEIIKNEGDFDFDDIGAELEIKSLKSEKKELDYRQVISTTTQTHVLTCLLYTSPSPRDA